jgi:hypothetical protein
MSSSTKSDAAPPPILEIQKARPALSKLVQQAVEQGTETHIGRRGVDEAVLVASSNHRRDREARLILEKLNLGSLEELRRVVRAQEEILALHGRAADPYAGLRTMLAERAIRTAPEPGRRLSPSYRAGVEEDLDSEDLTWDAVVAMGRETRGLAEGADANSVHRPLPGADRQWAE